MADAPNYLPGRLIEEIEMEDTRDWLSRLLEMMPVKGTLDYRCFLGTPWRTLAGARLGAAFGGRRPRRQTRLGRGTD